jgi:hypothetical protein
VAAGDRTIEVQMARDVPPRNTCWMHPLCNFAYDDGELCDHPAVGDNNYCDSEHETVKAQCLGTAKKTKKRCRATGFVAPGQLFYCDAHADQEPAPVVVRAAAAPEPLLRKVTATAESVEARWRVAFGDVTARAQEQPPAASAAGSSKSRQAKPSRDHESDTKSTEPERPHLVGQPPKDGAPARASEASRSSAAADREVKGTLPPTADPRSARDTTTHAGAKQGNTAADAGPGPDVAHIDEDEDFVVFGVEAVPADVHPDELDMSDSDYEENEAQVHLNEVTIAHVICS